MTKQKKSFFEKLTGIQKIDDESEVEINDLSLPKKEIVEDNPYEFPSKAKIDEDEDENDEEKETEEDFFGDSPCRRE